MPKRFEPNRRLLKILVGSNLYGAPDACVRELLQNSWDSIQLRQSSGDGHRGMIKINYSVRNRWFEVVDDGIGMDERVVEKNFLEIGQDKLDVLQQGTRDTQIGYFGIGILSIFLVAERFEVTTRKLDSESGAIRFEVTGIDDEIEYTNPDTQDFGTRIKIFLSDSRQFKIESIPEYVSNYARHVQGITIFSADDEENTSLKDRWVTDEFDDTETEITLQSDISELLGCRFAINPALRADKGALSSYITICNAGFLAEERVQDLLPLPELGMIGEIDLVPNALTMGMSRERVQRNERWRKMGVKIQDTLVRFARKELNDGRMRRVDAMDSIEVKRNILLWYHHIPKSQPFSLLHSEIEERVFETVSFGVADRSPSTLARIIEGSNGVGKLYYREIGRGAQTVERIDDEGVPIRITQEIRDSIRVGALRANGFDVVELGSIQVSVDSGASVQSLQVREVELVSKCLTGRGVSLVNIAAADASDMDLRSIERLPVLNDALAVGDGLRFADIPESKRRVIMDSTGIKYINLRNDDVRSILEVVPRAVSNPLRSRLLDAYLKLEMFQFSEARTILRDLLTAPDLDVLANVDTAPFTEKHIGSLIAQLLLELSD